MNENTLEIARKQYADVKIGFDVNKSLQYNLGVDALMSTLKIIHSPDAIQFVDKYLYQIVNILLDQSPMKLGAFEKGKIIESLQLAIEILLKLLSDHPHLVNVVSRVFDPNSTFYAGAKTYYHQYPGYPYVRVELIVKFANANGFTLVARALYEPETRWLGTTTLSNIYKTLCLDEVLTIVTDDLRSYFIEKAMHALQNLTDEQLKKENCDSITSLLRTIALLLLCHNGVRLKANEAKGIKRLDPFYQRWFGFVLRLMGSGSLVLKLLAWDVAHDLVTYATDIRPVPKAYSVEGSSLELVNGVYNFTKLDKSVPVYDRTPTRAGEPVIQLLRFNMKDKSVRWFLSTVKPGSGDIDYFQDMTTSFDRKLPSQNDWVGMANYQKSTPPTVRRLGYIMSEGVTEDMLLVSRLSKWAVDQDILSHVFGQNMHREIISRSDRLLVFLAENKAIRQDHLQMIWKAAMQSTTEDIIDEIWNILVGLSVYIDASLYQVVVDMALAQIKDEAGYVKVADFLESYNREQCKYLMLLQRSDIAPQILHLLWEIYRSPLFTSLKNSSNLLDLLSRCLQFKCGNAFVLQRIQESAMALIALNQNRNLNFTTDEVKASQIIHSLLFLMSRQMDETIVLSLFEENFPKALIDEIDRFVSSNYPRRISNELSLDQYSNGIAIRLNVLRRYFGVSAGVKINVSHIEILWELLSSRSDELNEFLAFLKNGGEHQDDIRMMIDTDLALEVFQRFICSSTIDWKLCNDSAFLCFVVYFNKLRDAGNQFSRQVSNQIQSLGLQSLWRIAMTIPSETSTKFALETILTSYNELSMEYHDAYVKMLNIIYDHLNDCIRRHSENKKFDSADIIRIERCIGILYEAILRSKQDTEPSHIVRGVRSRMVIKVFYKKMNAYFNYNTQSEMLTPMKGSEGMVDVEVHPMHTVSFLKKKIMEQTGFNDLSSIAISYSKQPLENNQRLYQVGISDGCEVSVVFKIALSKYSATPLYHREDFSSQGNVGSILSNDPQKFDILLSLCSLILPLYEISAKVWAILMLIPTKFEVWHQVLSFYVNDADDAIEYEDINWHVLSTEGPLPKLAYYLQIVDQILLPATDCDSALNFEQIVKFRQNFISRNGFKDIVEVLLTISSNENFLQKDILGTALHIIHYCLFVNTESSVPPLFVFDESSVDDSVAKLPLEIARSPNQVLLNELLTSSTIIVEKLLKVAGEASTSQDSGVVQDSLAVITALLQSSTVAITLINNPQAKSLLATVLRGASRKVRTLAADFAIQFGTTQSIVFKWLISVLDNLVPSDDKCEDIFRASLELLQNKGRNAEDYDELAQLLSKNLISFCTQQQPSNGPHLVLNGYLELLAALIGKDIGAVMKTALGENLLPFILEKFLFAIPNGSTQAPICTTANAKQAAFKVLLSLVSVKKASVTAIVSHINYLCQQSAPYMMFNWEMMLSQDVKRNDISYLGLKNQGCTCYSNSFLQQLFMNVSFRNAIMMTPLLEHHRTTLWHKTNEELVGQKLLFEFRNGAWHPGNIISYDPATKRHVVEYIDVRNNVQSQIRGEFNIREGRKDYETGRIRMPPPSDVEPIAERDDAANRVLEQLQRAFCFLEFSKKRFYDPRPLVEACKVLNLNFDVYHQNDAAEFCDQLLDRIETATKGKYTQKDIWNDVLKKRVFGGNFLTQKIPQECDTYQSDKKNCGHWQSSKQESFLKVELIIRGKETIDESLEELVQGELMDGENKIDCDVCSQKKAAIRRTCIESLPQTLIVHLKRFDLDFTTFETVKLNSKLEFPVKLNVLKYTKDGMEAEERKQQVRPPGPIEDSCDDSSDGNIQSHGNVRPLPSYGETSIPGASSSSMPSVQNSPTIEYEESFVEPDPADFEYELQGVLVHSGVAQGGHYYSFIRDPNEVEKWYRFDDDDVSLFTADQIPFQCFGGPSGQANSNYEDIERTSNALMLFYTKVKSTVVLSPSKDEIMASALKNQSLSSSTDHGGVLVDGYQAFAREVHESNLQHVLSCYLLDSDLHSFVRDVLSIVSTRSSQISSVEEQSLAQQTFQFSLKFLLDTILHCRERSGTKSWLQVFQHHFEAYPSSARWFLRELVGANRSWLREYLLISSDFMSRSTFVHVIMHAVTVLAPFDESLVNSYYTMGLETSEYGYSKLQLIISSDVNPPTEAYIAQLVLLVSKYVFEVPQHMRNADELFVLIRDLASIPCICKLLNLQDMISKLCFFIIPDSVYQSYKEHFVVPVVKNRNRPDYFILYGPIFEAIAALLGVPQVRKIALLQDNRTYWERQLVPEAKEALIAIFQEVSVNGFMDYAQISNFLEKVFGHKPHQSSIKHMLDSSNASDGKLTLDGFLQYYADKASYAVKELWMIFSHFGFRNDLTRIRQLESPTNSPGGDTTNSQSTLHSFDFTSASISKYSQVCLMNIGLYEAGMESNEEVTKAIVQRVCFNNEKFSNRLITMTTRKLFEELQINAWGSKVEAIVEFLTVILKIEDEFTYSRVRDCMICKDYGFLIVIKSERIRSSICRSNDYDPRSLYNRYIDLVQSFCKTSLLAKNIRGVVDEEPLAQDVRGSLRLRAESVLTEDEEASIRRLSIEVRDAGIVEVNGLYKFVDIMQDAGYFARESTYLGKPVRFTLYKCHVNTGQYQWFISITPENSNPGTSNDIDFYIANGHRGASDRYPPKLWSPVNNNRVNAGRAPTIIYVSEDMSSNVSVADNAYGDNYYDKTYGRSTVYDNVPLSSTGRFSNQRLMDYNYQPNRGTSLSSLDPTRENDSLSDVDSNAQQVDEDLDDSMLNTSNSPSRNSNSNILVDDDLFDGDAYTYMQDEVEQDFNEN